MESHLFTHSTSGLFALISIWATSSSVATRPERMSVTMMMASAVSIASCACSLMPERITSSEKGSMPPVSISIAVLPAHSISP